jgi:uncharacterized Zn finger protein (UPF0148 family)
MYSTAEQGDAHCIHCGTPIYFDVGIGSSACPGCGKNFEKTDEQLSEENAENERLAKALGTVEYWKQWAQHEIDLLIFGAQIQESSRLPKDVKKFLRRFADDLEELKEKMKSWKTVQ